ncbi:uncharacterized protein VTP21DRAFT_9609 [Calcarisporiella thermophila]|uniref:uncharacterized protein n=1 Tax=Calcarisporiella thermophila TaxID=911321 RepID=UPI00374228B1
METIFGVHNECYSLRQRHEKKSRSPSPGHSPSPIDSSVTSSPTATDAPKAQLSPSRNPHPEESGIRNVVHGLLHAWHRDDHSSSSNSSSPVITPHQPQNHLPDGLTPITPPLLNLPPQQQSEQQQPPQAEHGPHQHPSALLRHVKQVFPAAVYDPQHHHCSPQISPVLSPTKPWLDQFVYNSRHPVAPPLQRQLSSPLPSSGALTHHGTEGNKSHLSMEIHLGNEEKSILNATNSKQPVNCGPRKVEGAKTVGKV